jgi:hypothetical protein
MPRTSSTRLLVLLAGIAFSGCSSTAAQDVTQLLAATEVKTGWYDAGVENGMNKLLPTVVLTLKNVSSEPVDTVQLNAVVRRVGETEEWGGAFTKAIGIDGLPAGASTKPIVLRSNLGYTGVEPRVQMLKHKQFVDAQVQVFAKHGGKQWVKLGEWPIARELLAQ